MPTANAITDGFGVRFPFPNAAFGVEIPECGDGRFTDPAWLRDVSMDTPSTLGQCRQHPTYRTLAEVLIRRGFDERVNCIRLKGFGVRSVIIAGREYLLSGGRMHEREISGRELRDRIGRRASKNMGADWL